MRNLHLLLVGHPGQPLTDLKAMLGADPRVRVSTHALGEGVAPLLCEIQDSLDGVVLILADDWRDTLDQCFTAQRRPATKPLLVVGPAADVELMRAAMRVGARDFAPMPVKDSDLGKYLDNLIAELAQRPRDHKAQVTACMSARGGSGASLIAANLAYRFAKACDKRTVLVDLNLQFPTQTSYFNLKGRYGLDRAFAQADSLDAAALQGYLQQHVSGVSVLAATHEAISLPEDLREERVVKLIGILNEGFDEAVLDLPHQLSDATISVLAHSDQILLVTQQTVPHLHDVKRLVSLILRRNIPSDRLLVVVNRFHKREQVSLADFRDALPAIRIETLPGDQKAAVNSINLGNPLLELEPHNPLSRGIVALADVLLGRSAVTESMFDRLFRR